MAKQIILKELFNGLQGQMLAQLNTNRKFITHSGSKGDALEETWIEWLRKYLPNRYSVDKAIVIDSTGNTSDQLDIVIYDNWFTPFIFSQNGFNYIPAEGVYAVFEVKPDIKGNVESQSFIEYAGNKIQSVRRLKRTSTNIINAGKSNEPREFTKIIGGILSSTSTFKKQTTLINKLKGLKSSQGIDIGCIADYGCFYIDYNKVKQNEDDLTNIDKNDPEFINNINIYYSKKINYYYDHRTIKEIKFSEKENSLVAFSLQLTRYLQQAIGTIQAINLNAYAKNINFTIDEEL